MAWGTEQQSASLTEGSATSAIAIEPGQILSWQWDKDDMFNTDAAELRVETSNDGLRWGGTPARRFLVPVGDEPSFARAVSGVPFVRFRLENGGAGGDTIEGTFYWRLGSP